MMIASTLFFSSMHTVIRYISEDLHPFQIAFCRNLFGLAILVPIIVQQGEKIFRTSQLGLHAMRALIHMSSMLLFFSALAIAPIAKVTALSFTAPLFMALLGVLVFKERIWIRRWTAIIFGFIGALIVLRPGIEPLDTGSVMVLTAALTWAVTMIFIKFLVRKDTIITVTVYTSIFMTVLSVLPAVFVWQWPSIEAWGWLLFIGITGTLGQMTLAEALKNAEASAIMPFDFLKLIWAAALGYCFFAEIPTVYTWAGATLIFASGSYIVYRESFIARSRR